ncbi:MAG TPA: prepilin-type N-terminal cleavage/methylation domain-containing protein [Patescibacteria group bacterium]|nr:prepilin-type N-terminal cleavage/methylation domain-containing protein [Patescibacteria group bacterium]
MRKFSRGQSAFTLIEVIITIALTVMIVAVIANMFLTQSRLYRSQNAKLDTSASVRAGLDSIDDDVRAADQVLASYSTFTASSQTLILQIQSVDSTQALVADTYDYVVYTLSGTDLTRQIFPDAASVRIATTRTVARHVSDLSFVLNSADYADVTEVATSLTSSESTGNQTVAFTSDSNSKLRNN